MRKFSLQGNFEEARAPFQNNSVRGSGRELWENSGTSRVVTGKSLDSPENGNVDKMSNKCPENTTFRHFLGDFGLFGRRFCLVTLSNARPLQVQGNFGEKKFQNRKLLGIKRILGTGKGKPAPNLGSTLP